MAGISQTFSAAKVVDSTWLNRFGVQPFRAVVARSLFRAAAAVGPGGLDELSNTGLVVIEDFLPRDEFDRLRTEATAFAAVEQPTHVVEEGGSRTEFWTLPRSADEQFPEFVRWCGNETVLGLVSAAERDVILPTHGSRILEHLRIENVDGHDGQTDLHIDAPFDTHKLWLYLDDVTPEGSPFVYVPGSHKLDRVRLQHEYRESVGENRRSRKVTRDEVVRRGLEERSVTCRANTLVLANTCGYHRRAQGSVGSTRRALHMMFRSNPFDLRRRLRPLVRRFSP